VITAIGSLALRLRLTLHQVDVLPVRNLAGFHALLVDLLSLCFRLCVICRFQHRFMVPIDGVLRMLKPLRIFAIEIGMESSR
jgi:hypothetical protein